MLRVDCGYTNLIGKPVPCETENDCPQIWSRRSRLGSPIAYFQFSTAFYVSGIRERIKREYFRTAFSTNGVQNWRVDCGILSDKPVPCDTIYDCPQIWTRKYYCINNECVVYSISTIRP
ncbi:hypothetical protein P8452_25924 [Trifolium repens]|nr:hypothetical protein P8452_25924 [Trifolium repens]